MTLLRQGEQALDTGEGDVAYVDHFPLQDQLTRVRSSQGQQVVHNIGHLFILGLDLLQDLPVLLWSLQLGQRPGNLQVDNGERCAQFMAGVCCELGLPLESGFQAAKHLVKRCC